MSEFIAARENVTIATNPTQGAKTMVFGLRGTHDGYSR